MKWRTCRSTATNRGCAARPCAARGRKSKSAPTSLDEIDTPTFWSFLETAVRSFQQLTQTVDLEDVMPWKKLGQRWHLMRKGFHAGQTRRVGRSRCWSNWSTCWRKSRPAASSNGPTKSWSTSLPPGHGEPWATLYTKKPASLDLFLIGPKNMIGFGRVASLAWDRDLDATRPDRDVIRLPFLKTADLKKGDLREFLREHLEGVTRSVTRPTTS